MTDPTRPIIDGEMVPTGGGYGVALDLPPAQGGPEGGEVQAIQSGWRLALREFFDNRLAVVGLLVLVFFILFMVNCVLVVEFAWTSFVGLAVTIGTQYHLLVRSEFVRRLLQSFCLGLRIIIVGGIAKIIRAIVIVFLFSVFVLNVAQAA